MKTANPNLLGRRVRALREAKRWTQGELAESAQLSREAVSLIERGQGRAYWHTACALAAALGVSVSDLAQDAETCPHRCPKEVLVEDFAPAVV